jgi:hypothetical protein
VFGRVLLRAVAGHAVGQLGEPLRVAGEQVGVVECRLVGRDRGFEPLDFRRQPVKVALVLVR